MPAPIPDSDTTQVPVVTGTPIKFSPGIEEIVELVESGIEESILLAYIENSSTRFRISEEEIVYLRDIGTPESVIELLVRLDSRKNEPVVVVESSAEAPPPEISEPPVVIATPAPPAIPQTVLPKPVQKESVTVIHYPQFHSGLNPYGTWIDVPGYGSCWRPTVAVVNVDWRPYHDQGRWLYTDHGWYWQSDYSWGWAPFHYGRWHSSHLHGWVWVPGTVWGPSWVSWRHTDRHYGWAPLPPEATYHVGVGFSYRGSKVGFSFGFGLTDHHYTFLRREHFSNPRPWRYSHPRREIRKVYDNSTVINNYVINSNNTVINRGFDHREIAKVSRTEIRKVSVRDMPLQRAGKVRPDRIMRSGSDRFVYRPRLPIAPAEGRNALRRQELQKTQGDEGAGRGRSVTGGGTRNLSLARTGSLSSRPSTLSSNGVRATGSSTVASSATVKTVRSNGSTIRSASRRTDVVSSVQATPAAPVTKSSAIGTNSRGKASSRSGRVENGSAGLTQNPVTAVQRRDRLQSIGKPSARTTSPNGVQSRQSVPSVSARRNSTIQAQPSRSSAFSQASQGIQRRNFSTPQSSTRSAPAPIARRELKKSPSIQVPTKRSSSQQTTIRAYNPPSNSRLQPTRPDVTRTVPQISRSLPTARPSSPTIRSVPRRSTPPVQIDRSRITPSTRRSVTPSPSRVAPTRPQVTRTPPRTTRPAPAVRRSSPSIRSVPSQRSTPPVQVNRSQVTRSTRSSGTTAPSRSSGSASQRSRTRR